MLVFELIIFLLIVLAIAEVVCLILLYHRIFYQKKQSIDIFFICVFFIGFVCTLQFLSLLYIYESIKVDSKHELAPLFTTFSTVISALYTLPFAIVANNYRKR
mgnify:CR=1 FL=1